MTRDTSRDTDLVWFDPVRGYIFRDTEAAPEDKAAPSTAYAHCNHHHELTAKHQLVNLGDGEFVANTSAVPLLKALNDVGLRTRTHQEMTHEQLSAILYRHDPEGLAKMGAPSDEYISEAEIILPMLSECDGADDVQELLYETFASRFGHNGSYSGKFSQFTLAACEVWSRSEADRGR